MRQASGEAEAGDKRSGNEMKERKHSTAMATGSRPSAPLTLQARRRDVKPAASCDQLGVPVLVVLVLPSVRSTWYYVLALIIQSYEIRVV